MKKAFDLMMYVAVRRQSPQNWMGILDRNNKALAVSNKCLCFLSTTPFCYGVAVQEVWCMKP